MSLFHDNTGGSDGVGRMHRGEGGGVVKGFNEKQVMICNLTVNVVTWEVGIQDTTSA